MKYLRKFATEAEVNIDNLPCVALVADTGRVIYKSRPENGVYIQHIDGSLYTTEDWSAKAFSNDVANGVAVVADECSFVMAKEFVGKRANWSWNYYAEINGIFLSDDKEEAKTDFAGKLNTMTIIQQSTEAGAYAQAANICVDYVFPNGAKGYLGAAGEWGVVVRYGEKVIEAMILLQNTLIQSSWINWTSTQGTSPWVWSVGWSGNINGLYFVQSTRRSNTNMIVCPFTSL